MVNQKIENLRKELNQLIEKGADFTEIQRVSLLLDQCVIEYYDEKKEWYFSACGRKFILFYC